jgi:hypothetical protein
LIVFGARVFGSDERNRDAGLRVSAFTNASLQKTGEIERGVC